ncbi:MAG TPA: hypothetical protein VF006_26675 [Longimicrobium sp.]
MLARAPGAPEFTCFATGTFEELDYTTVSTLKRKGILINGIFLDASLPSPMEYLDLFLPQSHRLRASLKGIAARIRRSEPRLGDDQVRERARRQLASLFGEPYYLGELARELDIPYFLSPWEHASISWTEKAELKLGTGALQFLKDRLDAGAEAQLALLSELGTPVIFPSTPIAAIILDESRQPADLLTVALQLRDEYASFRRTASDLETQMNDESLSLARRVKIAAEIHSLGNLLGNHERGFYKETRALTGMLDDVAQAAADISGAASMSSLPQLLGNLRAYLTGARRRRKVRVLLRARKRFFVRPNRLAHVGQLFGVPKAVVAESHRLVGDAEAPAPYDAEVHGTWIRFRGY